MIVIDDDRVLLETAKETLRQIGIDAETADSGAKGLEMIMQRHKASADYRIILLDWLIPDITGLEITKKIRSEIGYDIPIIIVSSYDYTEIQDEAMEAGVNAFISKPLFKSTICKTLSELLNIGDNTVQNTVETNDISGMNILIAEDNALNYEIAEYLLSDAGATCYHAENGAVCVDMVKNDKEHKLDIVLMDVQMPVMKGDEATRLIRQLEDERLRNIPIIAMTADAFAENINECIDAGMDGHISKPINLVALLSEIQQVVGKR
jgi:CheY-like chemotaxis protein